MADATTAQQADKGEGAGWKLQRRLERGWHNIANGRFARVLRMARKPEPEEFRQSSTIVLVGIGVIGFIGFVVFVLMDLIV